MLVLKISFLTAFIFLVVLFQNCGTDNYGIGVTNKSNASVGLGLESRDNNGAETQELREDMYVQPDLPSDTDFGNCELKTIKNEVIVIGRSKVKHEKFHREDNDDDEIYGHNHEGNNKDGQKHNLCTHKDRPEDSDAFLNPKSDKKNKKVCMTVVACEQIVNNYLQTTEGLLLGKPKDAGREYKSYAKFKKNKSCKEKRERINQDDDDAIELSDAQVQDEVTKLLNYWKRH